MPRDGPRTANLEEIGETVARALPSLTAIKAFEAVGRTGSVRAAGDDLRISHTVVSRHLRHLQSVLGVALVRPEGRGLVLTPVGKAYHAEVSRAFGLLRRATAAIDAAGKPRLDVWCIPGIVSRRLVPSLPGLLRTLRRWEVNLQPTLAVPDLAGGEADAVVVFADTLPLSEALHVEKLVRPRVFPVASPGFLDEHPKIVTPKDLATGLLVHEESTAQWERWFALAGIERLPRLQGPRLWHAQLAVEAARLGQGIALANELLVETELREGTLVEPLASHVYMGWYQMVALRARWDEPAMHTLRRWLASSLELQRVLTA
jgi:LysR family glycine cleavage system transcriptional activator